MRELLRFLLVGVVSGWIAVILVRGTVRFRGCLTYTIVGVLGSLAGGYSFGALGISEVGAVIFAAVGAIALLAFVRSLRNR